MVQSATERHESGGHRRCRQGCPGDGAACGVDATRLRTTEALTDGAETERVATMLTVRRCLTCKAELTGVRDYCNDACFAQAGLSPRAPGRTAARRRRRRRRR